MIVGIDHLVLSCADPDAAAAELETVVGVQATAGGRHEGAGTFNRIAWLADGSYIELMGVDDAEAAARSPVGAAAVLRLEGGGGLATYALAADGLRLTAHALSAAGSAIGGAVRGTRSRSDGEVVEWLLAPMPAELDLPFLIEHPAVGAEWSPEAQRERAAYRHPIGSPVILARLDLATDDPPTLAARYHEHLGLEFWSVADLAVCTIGPHTVRLVPRSQMPVPAVVTLGAAIDAPRTADLLGVRFDIERVAVSLSARA